MSLHFSEGKFETAHQKGASSRSRGRACVLKHYVGLLGIEHLSKLVIERGLKCEAGPSPIAYSQQRP